jgi:anti-sigma factor RsiW
MSAADRMTDDAFIDHIRKRLDRTVDAQSLPPDVLARLAASRRTAVAAVPEIPVYVPPAWLPVGAMAATLVAAVLLRPAMDGDGVTPLLDDDTQLAAAENLDLLENLEFAAWMDESDGSDEG